MEFSYLHNVTIFSKFSCKVYKIILKMFLEIYKQHNKNVLKSEL